MRIRTISALAALVALAGCAPQVETTLYVSDLAKVAAGGGAMSTPALLRIPQSSEEDCTKGLSQLVANLKTLAPVSGEGKCVESDGDQLAEIETAILITASPDVPEPNLFAIQLTPSGDGTSLTFRMLKPIGAVIAALTKDAGGFDSNLDPAKFTLTLNNDDGSAIVVTPDQVFLDGAPAAPDAGIQHRLERRETVEIRFSDVAAAWVEQGHNYRFGSFAAAP